MFDDTVCNEFPLDKTLLLWLTYVGKKQTWYVVSDKMRTTYYLFKNNKQTRYKSDNPLSLYKYIKE